MSKTQVIITAVISLIIIALGYAISTLEWEKVETETGLSRKAELEPLLAASLFLENHQKKLSTLSKTESFLSSGEITLPKTSSLIIDEAALTEYKYLESAIVNWVNKGGHLIYVLSPKRDQLNLEQNPVISLTDVAVVETKDVASQRSALTTPSSNAIISVKEHSFSIYLAHRYTFENCLARNILLRDSEKTLICEENVADGYITFVPSINAISNDGLRHLDHGEYLLWLVGENDSVFYLPSTQSTSWLTLLWQWSWQVILLTVLFALLLMWQVSMRLGLAIEASSTTKNLFAKHIEAVGNFLFRYQHHDVLKNALLTDLANAIEKRQPTYKQLSTSAQAELISSLTGKKSRDIYLLLSEPLPENDNQRITFIKRFKELRSLL